MGVRGADRAIAVCDRLRELLPLLLAVSANSPFLDRRDTGLHTVRTEIFTRTFPRCGVPSPFRDWDSYAEFVGMLERTGSVVESTQLWWSVRPHHHFGTVEVRICDAQTRGEESFALAGLIAACIAQTALDYDEHGYDGAGRAAGRPRDRGEPLAGDPLRRRRPDDRLPPRRGGARRGRCWSRCWPGPSRRAPSSASRSSCRSETAPSGRARRSTPGSRSRTSTATRWPRRRRTYAGAERDRETRPRAGSRGRRRRLRL